MRIKGEFAQTSLCDFSCSGKVEKYSSIISLMSAMKEYFCFISGGCGIRNVYFIGTLEDWLKLREKIKKLKGIGLESWIPRLLYVVDHWIECYQGKVNVDFWNKMVDKVHGTNLSDFIVKKRSDFTGWIVYLAGKQDIIKGDMFPLIVFNAPLRYIEIVDGKEKEKNLKLYSGYSGLRYFGGAFRPQLSYAVVEPKEHTFK